MVLKVFSNQMILRKSLFSEIGVQGPRLDLIAPAHRTDGDRKITAQPSILAVPAHFRVSSGSILQKQVLFEGKKVSLSLVDAQGVPGGKASRWCSRMEPRQDAPGCPHAYMTQSCLLCACVNHTGEIHKAFLELGVEMAQLNLIRTQKRTAKFHHALPVSLHLFYNES